MKVKEESEKVGSKLNIQKTKIMASGPRIQPLWAPPQVCGGGGGEGGVVYPSVHSTAVNYLLPCARNLQGQTREDGVIVFFRVFSV